MTDKHLLAGALMALALPALTARTAAAQTAAQLGYTTFQFQRNNGVTLNSKAVSESDSRTMQGVLIHIDKEKAALLKGCTLTGVRAAFGTKHVSDMKIFVTREPGGTPIAESSVTGATTSAKNFNFDTPVTLDGGEFYVGYSLLLDSSDFLPLLFDRTSDLAPGTVWAYTGDGWSDISSDGLGAPILRMLVSDAPQFADLVVKPFVTDGYYKAGDGFSPTAQLFNFGTETVTSLSVKARVGGGEEAAYTLDGLSIAPGQTYDYTLPSVSADEAGHYALSIEVAAVNGAEDEAPADNAQQSSLCVYPADMTRKMLIEKFTGQACGNCPDGDTDLKNFVAGAEDNYVTVAHHAGYQPDFYTMAEDYSYTWFYGSSSTYAPAFMLNRSIYLQGQTNPVFGPSVNNTTTAQNFRNALTVVEAEQPYVKVDMANAYDPNTRKGKVTVTLTTYNTPDLAQKNTLNVWLTQDKLIGYQSGGGNSYEHNHVFRATLTGTWGEEVELAEGTPVTRTYEYEVPDSYFASYWDKSEIKEEYLPYYSPAAVPGDMQIVAFVGGVSASASECPVYNANTMALTQNGNAAGIHGAKADSGASAKVSADNGRLTVSGTYGTAAVYTAEGRLAATLNGGTPSRQLPAGVYIVRVDGGAAQKVLVK